MTKTQAANDPQQITGTFRKGGMAKAALAVSKQLPAPPIRKTTYPHEGVLDRLMSQAVDLSPTAKEAARREIIAARQVFLQSWLNDRRRFFQQRSLDVMLRGEDLECSCRCCGCVFYLDGHAGLMPDESAMTCPSCHANK